MKKNKKTKTKRDYKNLKLFFSSLINNAACVEGGRHKPWYPAVIMFILSCMVAVIPVTVNVAKTHGADFLSQESGHFQVPTFKFISELNEKNIDMVVTLDADTNQKYLKVDETKWNEAFATSGAEYKHYISYDKKEESDPNKKANFEVYYLPYQANKEDLTVTELLEERNKILTYQIDKEKYESNVQFMIFHHSHILYDRGLDKNSSPTFIGDWTYFTANDSTNSNGFNIKTLGGRLPANFKDLEADEKNGYMNTVFEGWREVFNLSYLKIKKTTNVNRSLLILGIDLILVLFMGLMIYILTRGKNNPFRVYTFWQSQKIAYWSTVSPAILALILGFLLRGFDIMLFPMFLGIRIMWLSMKTLRPEPAPSAPRPPKQKREKKESWSVRHKAKKALKAQQKAEAKAQKENNVVIEAKSVDKPQNSDVVTNEVNEVVEEKIEK